MTNKLLILLEQRKYRQSITFDVDMPNFHLGEITFFLSMPEKCIELYFIYDRHAQDIPCFIYQKLSERFFNVDLLDIKISNAKLSAEFTSGEWRSNYD
jgi:hypothetical protein